MICVHDASVSFGSRNVLASLDFSIERGELVSIIGPNGSGKSTFGRLMCAGILSESGSVVIDGVDPAKDGLSRRSARALVGYVQQDPFSQIVSSLVSEEVAFGPRNLGLSETEVSRRVERSLMLVGLDGFEHRNTFELSGGEQQRLAIAGVLAMNPSYLVLDEVTAQLDSAASRSVRELVLELARTHHMGIIQITHDVCEVLSSDRVALLRGGRVDIDVSVSDALSSGMLLNDRLLYLDAYTKRLLAAYADGMPIEWGSSPQSLYSWLADHSGGSKVDTRSSARLVPPVPSAAPTIPQEESSRGLVWDDVSFSYGSNSVLKNVSCWFSPGHVSLIAGPSGAGKSTFAALCAGLLVPDAGAVLQDGKPVRTGAVSLAFQRPETQFFLDTVFDEMAFAPRNRDLDEPAVRSVVREAAECVRVDAELFERSPFELSGGQARRVAVASVLTCGSRTVILDEPTAGLDATGRCALHALVRKLAKDGCTVVVISHDVEEWIEIADEVAVLADGRFVWQGSVSDTRALMQAFDAARIDAPASLAYDLLCHEGGASA